jgi:glutamate racemase
MKVKFIVVACNTASALTLDYLRRHADPHCRVIDPGFGRKTRALHRHRHPLHVRSEVYQAA